VAAAYLQPLLELERLESVKYVIMMGLGFELVQDLNQTTILVDDEGGANNPHKLSTHKLLQAPDAILVSHNMIFIGQ
jgi:hydrogenase maturation factor